MKLFLVAALAFFGGQAVRADECEEYRLWNADDNIGAANVYAYDDRVFCKPTTWKEFNFEAQVYWCGPAESMKFTVTNHDTGFTFTREEKTAPFFAFGNKGDDYDRVNGRDVELGEYEVQVSIKLDETSEYSSGGSYSSTTFFTFVDEDSGVPCEKLRA